jgi:hypothetical protein
MKRLSLLIPLFLLSAPVLSEPLSPGNMPAYCRGQAASDFGTKPVYIKTGKLVKAKDGSYSISGKYDEKEPFTCKFAANGEFTGMKRGSAMSSAEVKTADPSAKAKTTEQPHKAKTTEPSAKAIEACDMFMNGEKGHVEGFNDLYNGMFSVTLKYKSGFKHCEVSNEPRVDKFEDL